MATQSWILTANASEARLYQLPRARLFNGSLDVLSLVKEFDHPQSRKRSGDIISDRLGHYGKKMTGQGTFVISHDPKKFEVDKFARELAEVLTQGYQAQQCQDLIIIAAPQFHGLLNKHLNRAVSAHVSLHIYKDYTHCRERELVSHIQEYI